MVTETTRIELIQYLKDKRDTLVTQVEDEAHENSIRSQYDGIIAALNAGETPEGLVEILDNAYDHWLNVEANADFEVEPGPMTPEDWRSTARFEQECITRWLQELEPATN